MAEKLPEISDAFDIIFPYIEQFLIKERTKEEIAQQFVLPKKQVEDWLAKAEKLGKVKKLARPARYISTSTLSQQQLSLPLT